LYNLELIQLPNSYLNEDLAEQAWHGVIKKIVHLLSPLLQPLPMVGTQEERNRRTTNTVLSKRSLVEYCLSESSSLLSVQKYQLAFPAAIQALKFCKEIDGEKALSLVEPYLHLSQAALGMRQLKKAEEYLALARWIVLNHDDCSDKIRSRLYTLKGRVGTAEGNFDTAKEDYAQAIYYGSKCYGAESIVTSLGYYRIGDVFLAQGNMECALAYFDKVVDIWYKYLCELQHGQLAEGGKSLPPKAHPTLLNEKMSSITAEQLTEENLVEGRSQLESIFEHRKRLLGNGHIATGEVQYTLGLFEYLLLNNETMSETFIIAALQSYEMQLGPAHSSTKHVSNMLEIVQQAIADKYQHNGSLY
jgi:tetratricopeptide (TPR) repeat protein